MNETEKTTEIEENRRDRSSDKNKIKKAVVIIASVLAVLALITALIPAISALFADDDGTSYNPMMFFEPDYTKNILDDASYLALDRGVYFNRFGNERRLTRENVADISQSAVLFLDYFDCLVRGDAEGYRTFFTAECLLDAEMRFPERFTTQGVYDIRVSAYSATPKTVDGVELTSEIYEVSYRIYRNDGTFRDDILPDETRTLVFELYVSDGEAKINAIGYRRTTFQE